MEQAESGWWPVHTPDVSGDADRHQAGLVDFEAEAPDQVARRFEADELIFQQMLELDFDAASPIGRLLVQRLRREGTGTLVLLHHTGELFARARRVGVHLPRPPRSWPDDARSIIGEAGTIAAPRFVSSGLNTWKLTPPDGKAPTSILTYFVNSVLGNEFKTIYSKYCRRARAFSANEILTEPSMLPSGPSCSEDWTEHIADQAEVNSLLHKAPPRTAEIARQVADGVPHAEIARALNIGSKTVRRDLDKLARQRPTQHRRTGEEEE